MFHRDLGGNAWTADESSACSLQEHGHFAPQLVPSAEVISSGKSALVPSALSVYALWLKQDRNNYSSSQQSVLPMMKLFVFPGFRALPNFHHELNLSGWVSNIHRVI